ncbi:hypothetical protein K469DRAFT_586851, partial [Zopfia rhizophila CBS 207.26]
IIFVHGITSNPRHVMGTKRLKNPTAAQPTSDSGVNVCWASDLLPEDIPASFRKDMQIFFYNYLNVYVPYAKIR